VLAASGLYGRYLEPIGSGVVVFLVASAALAVPFLVLQYRRHGRVESRSTWVAASLLLYLICAWALVLLPFPADIAKYCATTAAKIQLVPFRWLSETIREAQKEGTGYLSLLTNGPLVIRVFNLLLLLPLGIYLRRWWGRGWVSTTAIAFGLSLGFELTQITGVWGLYDCSYRTFDVDDLVANTAGAALGWWAAPAFRVIPERGESTAEPRPVRASLPRRFLATLVDYVLALVLGGVVVAVIASLLRLDVTSAVVGRWTLVTGLVLVTVLWPLARGATPGQWFVLLRMSTEAGERPRVGALALRTLVLWGPWVLAGIVASASTARPVLLLGAVLLSPLWIAVVVVLTQRDEARRGPHERLSGTRTILRPG
jgi:glycopeptide antibiotics resistance protein